MRVIWSAMLLTCLTTGAVASADPVTLADLRLVQLAPNPAATISTVAPVGDGMLPTFFSTRTDYTLIASVLGWTPAPAVLVVADPLGTSVWSYPTVIDAITGRVSIPRVYRPTVFTAEARLLGMDGGLVDQRVFSWVASSPVPEPGTWLLVITGVGLMVWTDRRRRQR